MELTSNQTEINTQLALVTQHPELPRVRGSKVNTTAELAPLEKTLRLDCWIVHSRTPQQWQTVGNRLTGRASAQPGHIRARLVRVLRTAVAEIRTPLYKVVSPTSNKRSIASLGWFQTDLVRKG